MRTKKLLILAYEWDRDEGRLRADFQQYYGIDLDHAMAGRHTPRHIALLALNLPQQARTIVREDGDMAWGLGDVLLASILNSLNNLIWGMGDPRRRGRRPDPVGPSKLTDRGKRSLPARVMPINELMEQLSKPRR